MYATLQKAQPRALKIIENSIKNKRLSHAYLFTGPEGTYKKEMAYHFAMMLYCKEQTPCYTCHECASILENRHLNVYYIEPLGQNIKKEQIMALQEEFSKTSLVEGPRIYIINEADTMSISAANSLLKFIEEPTNEETYGILITQHKENILSTIISRSMVINFDQLESSVIRDKLKESAENELLIDSIASLTSNVIDANKMCLDEEFNSIINVMEKFIKQIENDNLVSLFYKANIDVLSNRERLKKFLILLECFYRDIYEYQISSDVITFKSQVESIKVISEKYSQEQVLNILFQILELIKKNGCSVNMNLLMHQFFAELNGGR